MYMALAKKEMIYMDQIVATVQQWLKILSATVRNFQERAS